MTLFEALIIQFQNAIFLIIGILIWAKIQNKTVKEFLNLDIYTTEVKLWLFGFLFVLWFGVFTYYRYILQLPLMGFWGYFW